VARRQNHRGMAQACGQLLQPRAQLPFVEKPTDLAQVLLVQAAAPQSKSVEPPHDGDGDDAAPAPVQVSPAPGTGQLVDVKA